MLPHWSCVAGTAQRASYLDLEARQDIRLEPGIGLDPVVVAPRWMRQREDAWLAGGTYEIRTSANHV
jgi:hypothetical protein